MDPTPSPLLKKSKHNEGYPYCPLAMDCTDEPLSESQRNAQKQQAKLFQEQIKKLEQMVKVGAKVTHHENDTLSFKVTEYSMVPLNIRKPHTNLSQISMPKAPQAIPRMPTFLAPVKSVLQPTPLPIQIRRVPPLSPAANIRTVNPSVVRIVAKPSGIVHRPANKKTENYPCLVVQPKVQIIVQNLSIKREELDRKVRQLLQLPPKKFTEWLMQHHLIPQQQYEGSGSGRRRLNLGFYKQDASRYPHSGGYVWISEKLGSRTTSVFKGSIFEIDMQPPTVIIKLLYHWACQSDIKNVLLWLKVDMRVINQFYQVFRAISLAAVQDELVDLGGPGKIVEIGLVSLGTTSQDGRRYVRVEVLGVLDRSTGNLRLRATEPNESNSRNERFRQILKPLPHWVNRNSMIITSNSVDQKTLKQMGYNVVQNTVSSGKWPEETNNKIMEYLSKIVPKMFRNSLPFLSTTEIQQFLDELTFREICGSYPLLCFDSMVERIGTQTKKALDKDVRISTTVRRIVENPFLDWRINIPEVRKAR